MFQSVDVVRLAAFLCRQSLRHAFPFSASTNPTAVWKVRINRPLSKGREDGAREDGGLGAWSWVASAGLMVGLARVPSDWVMICARRQKGVVGYVVRRIGIWGKRGKGLQDVELANGGIGWSPLRFTWSVVGQSGLGLRYLVHVDSVQVVRPLLPGKLMNEALYEFRSMGSRIRQQRSVCVIAT
jgi:hypothetical protein